MGGVYFLAFGSLLIQVRGLLGSRGILPTGAVVAAVKKELGSKAFLSFPTVFLFSSSDFFLTFCAAFGMVLALLLIAGILSVPVLILLWFLYLSFVTVGQEFLFYQWDALLLETGFMSIFLPLAAPPGFIVMFAYWFFIFRFIFSSGWVKLASGDSTWRNLRALCYHYETQPLPNRIAWYLHQLPEPVQKLSTIGVFFFELVVPFLALGPPSMRLAAFALLVSFQLLIFFSGNYAFFNLLTIVLCVPLLDDRYLKVFGDLPSVPALAGQAEVVVVFVASLFSIFLALNIIQLMRLFYRPHWISRLLAVLEPFGISNHYGLFAVMTTERLEFVIEGSHDLAEWEAYEFRWKPGNLAIPPKQVAPHQPRLDWQMWFAALDPESIDPWLQSFVRRLLQGSAPVHVLLKEVPFKENPPKYIRLALYRYHFTDFDLRRETRMWWQRTLINTSSTLMLKKS